MLWTYSREYQKKKHSLSYNFFFHPLPLTSLLSKSLTLSGSLFQRPYYCDWYCFFYYLSIFAIQNIAALVYLVCYFEDLYSTVSSTKSLYLSLRFCPGLPYFIKLLLVYYPSLSKILLILMLRSFSSIELVLDFIILLRILLTL